MSKWNWKHIYVMLANDGKVKIGVSKDVSKRAKSIELTKEVKIVDIFKTEDCSNPYTVERMCHELFKESRVFGEWFNVNFDFAVNGIKNIFEQYAKFEETAENPELINKIFNVDTENEKDEMMRYMLEIISSQDKRIKELSESVTSLAKATENVSEMFKDLVFLLDEKFALEKIERRIANERNDNSQP